MRRATLFGYAIATDPLETLGVGVMDSAEAGKEPHFLVAMNPVKVMYAERDPRLHEALTRATVLYPDGYGICWAFRIVTGLKVPRVPGVDLAQFLLSEAERRGKSVYLLGAAPDVNRAATETVRRRHPRLRIAGAQHGYFARADEERIVRSIRESRADVILVAMGSPRQEEWIDEHLGDLGVGVALGVGGTFDVLAGAARRAPRPVQNLGLEWAWRAVGQPAKVRRVLATRPHFVLKTLREAIRHRGRGGDAESAPLNGGNESRP